MECHDMHLTPDTPRYRNRDALASALLCAVLFVATYFVIETEGARRAQEMRNHVTEHVAALHAKIEAELNANVFLANGLAAYVSTASTLDPQRLETALKSLFRLGQHIRNIGVAPGNRIAHVYPLEGNEAVIGLYYPDIPAQWRVVRQAIESKATALAGPVTLVQGGNGLISRTPVFLENEEYWGILSLVLDSDQMFADAGLAPVVDGVRYAMRGRNGLGADGEVFFGDPDVFESDAVVANVPIPGGLWLLAAAPVNGWNTIDSVLLGLLAAGFGLSVGVSLLLFLFLRKGARLEISERRARAFLETTLDGVIVIGDGGLIREFNAGAGDMLGYDPAEVIGSSVNQLMFEVDAKNHDAFIQRAETEAVRTMGARRDVMARHKDGTAVPVEIRLSETWIGRELIHIGIVRDIRDRKALEQKLRLLADTDGLTGLLNRRAFMDRTAKAVDLARRHGRPLALLMLDADHFKRVNDTYGHPAGDAVLIRLAAIGSSSLRTPDEMGRIGGEEFAILLPETDKDGAVILAERLLAAIRKDQIDIGDAAPISITVSVGVAVVTDTAATCEALVQQADQALYAAKAGGRDRWAVAEDEA